MGSQIPTWVTIALGVVALLGPWGGAWLTARREDRRWIRETRREEMRWERERERQRAEHRHETRLRAREQRFDAYQAFTAALDRWLEELHVSAGNRANVALDHIQPVETATLETGEAALDAYMAVDILASAPVREIADKITNECGAILRSIQRNVVYDDTYLETRKKLDTLDQLREDLIAEIRKELVEDELHHQVDLRPPRPESIDHVNP